MKKVFLFILVGAQLISSCNNISRKSVSEKLSIEELSESIKSDTSFSLFYKEIRKDINKMDDIKLAKFNDITYNRLFKYYKFIIDTSYWKPLSKEWEKEWRKKYGKQVSKADSTLRYWKKFLKENSLDRYLKIELAQIDKEYYEYIGGLKEVNLGFKLTPLKGPIEQVCFNYGYTAKINDDTYFDKYPCILTSPLSSPTIRYWEVGYVDQEDFSGRNAETFLRDYNLYIEITSIRKNGVNINVEDFDIPEEVSECFENAKKYPELLEFSKDDLIKKLINKKYVGKREFIDKKASEVREDEDKLCFDFIKEL